MAIVPFPFGAISTAVSLLLMHGISITMFRAFLNQTIPSLETLRTNEKYHITFTRPGATFSSGSSRHVPAPPPPATAITSALLSPSTSAASSSSVSPYNLSPDIPSMSTSTLTPPVFVGGPAFASSLTSPGQFASITPPIGSTLPFLSVRNMAENLLTSASSRNPLLSPSTGRFNLINPLYQNALNANPLDKLLFSTSLAKSPVPSPLNSLISLSPTNPSPSLANEPPLISPNTNLVNPSTRITFTPVLSKRLGDSANAILFPIIFKDKSVQYKGKFIKNVNHTLSITSKSSITVNQSPIIQEIPISLLNKLHHTRRVKHKSETQRFDTIRRVCYFLLRTDGHRSQLHAGDLSSLDFCSHIVISDIPLDSQYRVTFHDVYNDSQALRTLVARKRSGQSMVKMMISIGGAQNRSNLDMFAKICSESKYMYAFVDSALEMVSLYNLDGIDLNLKFAKAEINHARSVKHDLPRLLQTFRRKLSQIDQEHLELSAILSNSPKVVDAYYNLKEFERNLNFVNVVAYDLHEEDVQRSIASHHSPLYSADDGTNNLDWLANYWLNTSLPREQINIGLSTFGRTYNLAFNNVRSINVPIAGLGINNGTIGYGEICDFLSRPETTYIYNERLQVPFAYNGYDLIAFENEKSLAVKCRYVNQQQFGGVMILALNFDDFDDKCNRNDVDGSSKSMQTDTGRRFPLHNSIYRTLQFGSLTRNHMYRL